MDGRTEINMNNKKTGLAVSIQKENMKKRGFSLIELMITISIISVLASIVLVSLSFTKQKAKDASALASIRSTQAAAYRCLLRAGLNNIRLKNINSANVLCCYNSSGIDCDTSVDGFPNWPDIANTGWGVSTVLDNTTVSDTGTVGWNWCTIGTNDEVRPSSVGSYSDGSIGGSRKSGDFCYILKNGTRYIWCTETGCRKQGF